MPKVSISEAARMAGIARSTLYRAYIDTGKVSIEKDVLGKPVIDVSELVRVFPDLEGVVKPVSQEDSLSHCETCEKYKLIQADVTRLEAVLEVKEAMLERAISEVDWLKKKVDAMEQRLLPGPDTKRRWWWPW